MIVEWKHVFLHLLAIMVTVSFILLKTLLNGSSARQELMDLLPSMINPFVSIPLLGFEISLRRLAIEFVRALYCASFVNRMIMNR